MKNSRLCRSICLLIAIQSARPLELLRERPRSLVERAPAQNDPGIELERSYQEGMLKIGRMVETVDMSLALSSTPTAIVSRPPLTTPHVDIAPSPPSFITPSPSIGVGLTPNVPNPSPLVTPLCGEEEVVAILPSRPLPSPSKISTFLPATADPSVVDDHHDGGLDKSPEVSLQSSTANALTKDKAKFISWMTITLILAVVAVTIAVLLGRRRRRNVIARAYRNES